MTSPYSYLQNPNQPPSHDVNTVTTTQVSPTGATQTPDGFLPVDRADPTPDQPGYGVYAPIPDAARYVVTPLTHAQQVQQVGQLMGSLSSFAQTFEFIALPPEVNAARLTFGAGEVPLQGANAAYTAMAAALHTAAGDSDGTTATMTGIWPTGHTAQAAFSNHAGWLHGQAENAARSAQVASAAAGAYMSAVGIMPPVAECLAAKAAAAAAMTAAATTGAMTPAALGTEHYYDVVLRGQAATSMTTYSAAANTIVAGLPTVTPPPEITSGGGGGPGGPGLGMPVIGGGGAPLSPPTAIGSPVSLAGQSLTSAGSQAVTSAGSQAVTSAGTTLGNQAANTLGQAAAQQLPSLGPGDSALADALNPPGAENLPDYAGYGQHFDPYGLAPYSSTLAGLSGGAVSMVAMNMVQGGVGTMSGAATGFRMPSNWVARTAKVFGALDEQAPESVAPSAASRGASAPAEQMRRDKEKKRKASGRVIAPGADPNVPDLEDAPVIGVLEFRDDEAVQDVADDLALSFGVLENADEDPAPQYVAGDSHRD
ncbi:PPE domain-containing protein [Nocardia sp. NEAU-G5]|uniref:PPE domain-containing protein n=1 Tax=Nocardia albiluteola TaxID=2842303 RepID=A0ABS6B955_9NOCA|nr:PPE domain-containing protein [Nocardia albiluteola]MBU3066827.1 PPE domain-containing protein [Nocardia albiluteola]